MNRSHACLFRNASSNNPCSFEDHENKGDSLRTPGRGLSTPLGGELRRLSEDSSSPQELLGCFSGRRSRLFPTSRNKSLTGLKSSQFQTRFKVQVQHSTGIFDEYSGEDSDLKAHFLSPRAADSASSRTGFPQSSGRTLLGR